MLCFVEHLFIYFSICLLGEGGESWLQVIMMFYLILITSHPHSQLSVLPGFLHTGTIVLKAVITLTEAKLTTWIDFFFN